MPIFKKIYKGAKKPKNNREMSKFDKSNAKNNKNNFNKQPLKINITKKV